MLLKVFFSQTGFWGEVAGVHWIPMPCSCLSSGLDAASYRCHCLRNWALSGPHCWHKHRVDRPRREQDTCGVYRFCKKGSISAGTAFPLRGAAAMAGEAGPFKIPPLITQEPCLH
ncbi:Hypothetical predicted protein [Podarcis lilfordi]|uniref:Uncharacterized protein n=1 Tax=Podarcis lilfordi TaxID=74358 RepID=A0AA35L658_9SAUR|nr:Hypothetical predicted protein [Podarcis lilfordi]